MKKSIHSEKHKQLCEFLISARQNAHLTQQSLADKLNVHQSFIAKYEGGERRLDIIELLEISEIIGFKIDDLIKIIATDFNKP